MHLTFFLLLMTTFLGQAWGGFIYQNFETSSSRLHQNISNSTTKEKNLAFSWDGRTSIVSEKDKIHSGKHAWKIQGYEKWIECEIFPAENKKEINFFKSENDRFSFWIKAFPNNKSSNNVGVTFFDTKKYLSNGYTVWSNYIAKYGKWTKISILFSQLPHDIDLEHISKIRFINYWPGTYYFDDILIHREPLVYQSFEKDSHAEKDKREYAWTWNKNDSGQIISKQQGPVFDGNYSFKLTSKENWGGCGVQSEFAHFNVSQKEELSFWNTDLNPELNTYLSFWVYAQPGNQLHCPVLVQFFEHAKNEDTTVKTQQWTSEKAQVNKWTQLLIPLEKIKGQINCRKLNKIQFQFRFPGVYYLDQITIIGPFPQLTINNAAKPKLFWHYSPLPLDKPYRYQLQYSPSDNPKNWSVIYQGSKNQLEIDPQSIGRYRVRFLDLGGLVDGITYFSPWSLIQKYGLKN